jgi:hypothetical protein
MALDIGGSGGGAEMLQDVLTRLGLEAYRNQDLQLRQQENAQAHADRMAALQSLDQQRQSEEATRDLARTQAQAASLTPGDFVTKLVGAKMIGAGLGNEIKPTGSVLPSTAFQGAATLGPTAPSVDQMSTTDNPGHDEGYTYTGSPLNKALRIYAVQHPDSPAGQYILASGGTKMPAEPAFDPKTTDAELLNRYIKNKQAETAGVTLPTAEKAWNTAYETGKRVTTDATSAAAAARQAAGFEQQNKNQARAEDFTEAEKGRERLLDVDKEYATAARAVQELRDIVTAAQAGNKYAASQQTLAGTLATIRNAGLNRINATEYGASKGAGNSWDRIQGWFGQATAGQPVPPDIQRDMLNYADVLDKSAQQEYLDKSNMIKQTYNLKDVKLRSFGSSSKSKSGFQVLGEIK